MGHETLAKERRKIEVNRLLLEPQENVATLRRELVAEKLMQRDKGVYRLSEQTP